MLYDDKKFIGEIIKNARKKVKMKQAELAEKIDMSDKNLGNIENGKQFPQLNNFFRILEVLDLQIEDFGVNSKKDVNKIRELILHKLYLMDDYQLEIYLNLVEMVSKLTYKS